MTDTAIILTLAHAKRVTWVNADQIVEFSRDTERERTGITLIGTVDALFVRETPEQIARLSVARHGAYNAKRLEPDEFPVAVKLQDDRIVVVYADTTISED